MTNDIIFNNFFYFMLLKLYDNIYYNNDFITADTLSSALYYTCLMAFKF